MQGHYQTQVTMNRYRCLTSRMPTRTQQSVDVDLAMPPRGCSERVTMPRDLVRTRHSHPRISRRSPLKTGQSMRLGSFPAVSSTPDPSTTIRPCSSFRVDRTLRYRSIHRRIRTPGHHNQPFNKVSTGYLPLFFQCCYDRQYELS